MSILAGDFIGVKYEYTSILRYVIATEDLNSGHDLTVTVVDNTNLSGLVDPNLVVYNLGEIIRQLMKV